MNQLPRGTVTLLFSDIEGSTRLLQQLGSRYREFLEEHHKLMRASFEAHGGHEVDTQGDGFFVAFPTAGNAVRAAVETQQALARHVWPDHGMVRVRMAVHTGEPSVAGNKYIGLDVHRAARLCAAGHGGQVLVSEATRAVVEHDLPSGVSLRDLGHHRLKDLPNRERVWQLVIVGLPALFPPLRTLEARANNLPAEPTPLVGREGEVASRIEQMRRSDVRLLTLTGPGGVGKTRLALRIAAGLLDDFRDGVVFVSLAPLRDPSLILPTIAHTLGIHGADERPVLEVVKAHLQDRHLLLVLDNFEQVLDAAPVVAELLASCPHLKVLVTSRTRLRISGEHDADVPPLAVPEAGQTAVLLDAAMRLDAVRLFVARAQASSSQFGLTKENAPAVLEICRRLEGVPLAIELAAARIRLLPPSAMLARLHAPLAFLTGGPRDLPARQRTLRDTVAWSYDLLSEPEQILFRRLGVFVNGFTLPAVEAVCGGIGAGLRVDVMGGLQTLFDMSLVRTVATSADDPRFSWLETIREFAVERLESSGEAAALRRRHADYYLCVAEEASSRLYREDQDIWLARFDAEHDNLRAALDVSCAAIPEDDVSVHRALRLAAALWRFWLIRGFLSQGETRLAAILSAAGDRADASDRARAVTARGLFAYFHGDLVKARALCETGLCLSRETGEHFYRGLALNILGTVARSHGEYGQAVRLYDEALSAARQVEDRWLLALSITNRGVLAFVQGDNDGAAALDDGLSLFREVGDKWYTALMLHACGRLAQRQADYRRARALHEESLTLFQELQNWWGLAVSLAGFAALAQAEGEPERAARLLGAEEALRTRIDAPVFVTFRTDHERCVTAVRADLGEERFAAASAEGRATPLDEAIAYALASQPWSDRHV